MANYGAVHNDGTSTTSGNTDDPELGAKNGSEIDALLKQSEKDGTGRDWNTIINAAFLQLIVLAFLGWLIYLVYVGVSMGLPFRGVILGVPAGVWQAYNDFLVTKPLLCKACTSATVYFLGDIIAQGTEGTDLGEFDRMRTVRSSVAGFIGHGPLSHFWYHLLDHIFNDVLQFTAWYSVFFKVVVDQVSWGPFWNNTYIVLLGIMKLSSPIVIWADMKRTTIPLIISGLKLWPAVHIITYGVIPVEFRLAWVDFIEIIWVIILSLEASGRMVLDVDDEETQMLLDEDDDTIILHSAVIPEHFYGGREEAGGRRASGISVFSHLATNSAGRRESIGTLLTHRREAHAPGGERRRSSLAVRGSFAGGQIWVM